MTADFCAFCFGPLGDGKTTTKRDRAYHAECASKDTPAATGDRYTLPSGVKVGGRGAEAIAKHPGAFAKRQGS